MSTQSAENYLDELLNSVSSGSKQEALKEEDIFAEEIENQSEIKLESDEAIVARNTAKAEAEFLMEFEKELAGDDFDDFLKDFEENNILPEDRLEEEDMQLTEEDALLSMLGGSFTEDLGDVEPVFENSSDKEEISLEELALSGIEVEEIFSEEPAFAEPSFEESPFEEPNLAAGNVANDSIDLSQMGEEDLISLLAGADDLSDIGQLFAQNDNNLPVEGEDPFAAFAEQEMSEKEEEVEVVKEKKKAPKKGNFLARLSTLLFGKEEEEQAKPEPVSIVPDEMPGVVELSEENADILSLFAEADATQVVEAPKGKKKEKKKKEPKAKAPKKPKAPKAPKPKKEKKPKEKDNTPPLPKGPVVLVCLLAISIFVFVFFGTELIGYASALSKAQVAYDKGDYSEAAAAIAGVTIREEDMMIQGKISTLATVHSQLSEYDVFMSHDRKAEALDSLISAAGRCELNEENTLTFDCVDEMQVMKNRIVKELEDGFSMTYERAIELYDLTVRDRAEYTRELRKVYEKLGLLED